MPYKEQNLGKAGRPMSDREFCERLLGKGRKKLVPFGPPPQTDDIREWERQLITDLQEVHRLNPPIPGPDLYKRIDI